MQDLLTGDDLFSEIILLRSDDDRAIILLEGPSDCRALDAHLNEDQCKSIPAHGKDLVINAVELANQNGITGIVGVLDQDYDHLFGLPSSRANIVYVDAHDLDSLVFYAPTVASRVWSQFASMDVLR